MSSFFVEHWSSLILDDFVRAFSVNSSSRVGVPISFSKSFKKISEEQTTDIKFELKTDGLARFEEAVSEFGVANMFGDDLPPGYTINRQRTGTQHLGSIIAALVAARTTRRRTVR